MNREEEIREELELLEANIRGSTDEQEVFDWSKRLSVLQLELEEITNAKS